MLVASRNKMAATFITSLKVFILMWAFNGIMCQSSCDSSTTSDNSDHITRCLNKEQNLVIANPFPNAIKVDFLNWERTTKTEIEQILLTYHKDTGWSVKTSRAQKHDQFGLKIIDIQLSDSGNYAVCGLRTKADGNTNVFNKVTKVVVATPPELSSAQLTVAKEVLSDGTVELKCGQLKSRGVPEVSIVWTTPKGTAVNSSREADGFWFLTLDEAKDESSFTCHVDKTSDAAQCIPDTEWCAWDSACDDDEGDDDEGDDDEGTPVWVYVLVTLLVVCLVGAAGGAYIYWTRTPGGDQAPKDAVDQAPEDAVDQKTSQEEDASADQSGSSGSDSSSIN